MSKKNQQPQQPGVPPDGGFGWVIVGASFFSLIIVDGIIFSFGVFFREIQLYYNETKQKTALIGSLLTGVYLLIGPVVSALANRYTCRNVTICGSFVAAIGFILSYFAPNVNTLCITYGLIIGTGFGMIYLPAIVMVGQYFNQKRALATGIAVSGSSIGTFIFAPLSKYLIDEFYWKGAVLVIAGLVLHGIAAGLLFRPLELYVPCTSQQEHLLENNINNGPVNGTLGKQTLLSKENMIINENSHYLINIEENSSIQPKKSETFKENDSIDSSQKRSDSFKKKNKSSQKREQKCVKKTVKPFYRNDVFLSQTSLTLTDISNIQHGKLFNYDKVDHIGEKEWSTEKETIFGCIKMSVDSAHVLKNMLDVSLLKSHTFILLCISAFLTFLGLFTPFIFIVDYAEECGYDKTSATALVSVIGATNTVGRIMSGWMSDKLENKALFLNNIALTLGGIATCICPLVTNYIVICICIGVFGIAVATFASLRSIILVELLGLEKLSNAFGLNILFMGVACILGPPFAGHIYDITKSYIISFNIAGIVIALSGLIAFPLPKLHAWEMKQKNKASKNVDYHNTATSEPL